MSDTAVRPLVPPPGWLGQARDGQEPLSPGFLAAATVLGAALRLGGLLHQSLWVDEIRTWAMVKPGVGLHFLEQVRDAIQGPLYVAVVWPLVRLGDPELMLRLPAAMAGALTVPLFGAVAGRLLERRAARLAVLLVAINPFLVWYSQEARGYAFAVLFGTAMVWAFLRQWERGPNRRDGVLFALASTAAVAGNMSALFLWGALGLTALPRLARRPQERLGWVLVFGGGLAASAPWLLQAAGIWAVDRIVPGAATGEASAGHCESSIPWRCPTPSSPSSTDSAWARPCASCTGRPRWRRSRPPGRGCWRARSRWRRAGWPASPARPAGA